MTEYILYLIELPVLEPFYDFIDTRIKIHSRILKSIVFNLLKVYNFYSH
jgi:hypothetical protein